MSIPAHLWLEDENGSPNSRQLFDATAHGFYRVKILFSWDNYSGRSKLGKTNRYADPSTCNDRKGVRSNNTAVVQSSLRRPNHEEGDNQDVPHSGNRYRRALLNKSNFC